MVLAQPSRIRSLPREISDFLVNTGEALNEHCDVVGVVASTLYATPVAVAFSPEPSTRGVVNIT